VTFGVYFYDGSHDYRSQLLGLLLAVPLLARRALLVLDDGNWPAVRQALGLPGGATASSSAARPADAGQPPPDLLERPPGARLGRRGVPPHDPAAHRSARQTALLESLDALQAVRLRREGNTVRVTPAA
jgi:hypothetical protein